MREGLRPQGTNPMSLEFDPIVVPQCCRCRHFDTSDPSGPARCKAFPDGDGIPAEIFLNKVDHHDPFPGDHGVRFEPAEGAEDWPVGGGETWA